MSYNYHISHKELQEITRLDESRYIPEGYHRRGIIFHLLLFGGCLFAGLGLIFYEIKETQAYGFDLFCALEHFGFGLLLTSVTVYGIRSLLSERYNVFNAFTKGTPIEGTIIGYENAEQSVNKRVVIEFIDHETKLRRSFDTLSTDLKRDYALDTKVLIYKYNTLYFWNIWYHNVETRGKLIPLLAKDAPRVLKAETNIKLMSQKHYDAKTFNIENNTEDTDTKQLKIEDFINEKETN